MGNNVMDRLLLFCVAMAITPATILLLFIILIATNSDLAEIDIAAIGSWVSAIATIGATVFAGYALTQWKSSITGKKEFDIDLESEALIRKVQDLANSYAIVINTPKYSALKSEDNNVKKIWGSIPFTDESATLMKNARKLQGAEKGSSIIHRSQPKKSTSDEIIELCSILTNSTIRLKYHLEYPNSNPNRLNLENVNSYKKLHDKDAFAHEVIDGGKVVNRINILCDEAVNNLHKKWND